ncbi:uncharacterized protein LOC124164235 isoform X2 [Ischnura elegans]|uniref:uncharacterized protein LOC124164235 isoform X2 n=1 Tax=Ischnura elegans TaxID=197161 RepID=UPI001ED872F0|nr:uncharacterized protein LOC124164235 isoform X2 [Ischnura elegans]
MNILNSLGCLSDQHHVNADSTADKVYSRISFSLDKQYAKDKEMTEPFPQLNKQLSKRFYKLCPCFKEADTGELLISESARKRWRVELENTAYLILSDARSKHYRQQQKIQGVKKLQKLVKKIKNGASMLTDEDSMLLIRCCLHAEHYFAQEIDNGEYLLRTSLHHAHVCYIEALTYLPYHQNHVITIAVIRFLQDGDRWNNCDFGIKIMRTLLTVRGRKFILNVEGEILLTFIAHMVPHCPRLSISIPNDSRYDGTMNFFHYSSKLDEFDVRERLNLILDMARVLHGMLIAYEFKDLGVDAWDAFDILVKIYIKVLHAVISLTQDDEVTESENLNKERRSHEWDILESALRGCIKHFVDDVLVSSLRFQPCKAPKVNQPVTADKNDIVILDSFFEYKKESKISKDKGEQKWDNMSQVIIAVLHHTVSSSISKKIQYQLLDLIVTTTRIPVGYRSLKNCLPEKLLSLILQAARQGDYGVNLRSLKLFQNLLDRHSLRFHILSPRIFKGDTPFSRLKGYEDDLEYFQIHRGDVYDTLYKNFLTHSNALVNLEALYTVICLIVIEIQYPLVAREIAELMINIQNSIIAMPDLPIQSPRVSAWVHATVISVLSFVATMHGLVELQELVLKDDLFFGHASVKSCLTNSCFETGREKVENESSSPGS